MNRRQVERILSDTAYVRTSGTEQEKECAEYIKSFCENMGLAPKIESFSVPTYETITQKLVVDGKEIPCKAFFGSGSGTVQAPLFYLTTLDEVSLKKCKGKIVLMDRGFGYAQYDLLVKKGAKALITYSGDLFRPDHDLDQKVIGFEILENKAICCVNIHVRDAFELVKNKSKNAEISVEQKTFSALSQNVILDFDGKTDETIVVSAHYDSTSLSTGAYDNMSGCIGLFALAEHLAKNPCHRRIRLLWCGSEESGLLGSLAYCRMHKEELQNTVLNVNFDMLGSVMGEFAAFSCINEEVADFLKKFLRKHRVSASVRYAIRSSDSNSFIHWGVPALTFARYAPSGNSSVHTRYDTAEMVSAENLLADMKIITKLTEFFGNAQQFPVSMEISEKIKTEVESYMKRKVFAKKENELC